MDVESLSRGDSKGASTRKFSLPDEDVELLVVISRRRNCFLCFMRRFWNHVFTCVSLRPNAEANSTRSGVDRYLCMNGRKAEVYFIDPRFSYQVCPTAGLRSAFPSQSVADPRRLSVPFVVCNAAGRSFQAPVQVRSSCRRGRDLGLQRDL